MYVFTPTITTDNSFWYRGTADAIYQNLSFLRNSHEPYAVICSGDGIYKLDFNKLIEYHIRKKADITVVCKRADENMDITRYGIVSTGEDMRITSFDEKPFFCKEAEPFISTGIYVIRRRQLIERIDRVQTFVTCTDVSDLAGAKLSACWHVRAGELTQG